VSRIARADGGEVAMAAVPPSPVRSPLSTPITAAAARPSRASADPPLFLLHVSFLI
jgi:hypothetical protein